MAAGAVKLEAATGSELRALAMAGRPCVPAGPKQPSGSVVVLVFVVAGGRDGALCRGARPANRGEGAGAGLSPGEKGGMGRRGSGGGADGAQESGGGSGCRGEAARAGGKAEAGGGDGEWGGGRGRGAGAAPTKQRRKVGGLSGSGGGW